ncbi:MAG: hypothetical protein JNM52_00110 [Betaproteobacteria bacterium]|nr:hypothetical protein [Betaproteobacteria bacterium]
MDILRKPRRAPLWFVAFDTALIAVCITTAVQTNNWGYALIAAGMALFAVVWYFNPISLNTKLSSITQNNQSASLLEIGGIISGAMLLILGAYITFL